MNMLDLLELTLYQTYNSTVQVRNVLHYRVGSVGTADETGLTTAFIAEVLPLMLDVQHLTMEHQKMTVLNLTDNIGWADVDLIPDQQGVLGGEVEPPFVCYAFRKNRALRRVRSGQLRVCGVPEGAINYGLAGPLVEDDLDQLAVALGETIIDGTGGSYVPVIIGKNPDGTVRDFAGIESVEFVSISTQNSRKYGRGI